MHFEKRTAQTVLALLLASALPVSASVSPILEGSAFAAPGNVAAHDVLAHQGRGGDEDRSGSNRGSDDDDDRGDDGSDDDIDDDDNDDNGSGSGRDKAREPGGSGCDDPEDIEEHPECAV